MHLSEGFVTHQMPEKQVMVAVGEKASQFRGIAFSNETAAFIVDALKKETSAEAIVEAMAQRYDAPREVIARDVDQILAQLRSIGALEE